MKRSRIMVASLVGALMIMGGVYAAWTQTVTVNGTVESGELKVDSRAYNIEARSLTPFSHPELAEGTEFAADEATMEGFVEESEGVYVSNDGSNAVIQINGSNFYPGMKSEASFAFTNSGTIPVKVGLADNFEPFGVFEGDYQFLPSPDLVTYEFILEKYEDVTITFPWWLGGGTYTFTTTVLIPQDTFEDLDQALQDMGEIAVGDGFKVHMELNVGINATEEEFPENNSDTYVLPIKFTQFNVN